MTDLDDLDLGALDPGDTVGAIVASPEQWSDAAELATAAPRPEVTSSDLRAVYVVGMGGSGIAGDVAVQAAAEHDGVPVIAVKDYTLPGVVGPDTLVIAVSYSGNTEETLACVDQAIEGGAPVYVVTSGGQLSEVAAERGLPMVGIPGGRQPRASLGYLSGPVLGVLDQIAAAPGTIDALYTIPDALAPLVAAWGPTSPTADNAAKQMAFSLRDLVPVFYGGGGWSSLVALRAKCQVNENAKRPAFAAVLPELDHNEVLGWAGRPDQRAGFALVPLRDPAAEHPQVTKRFTATLDLVGEGFGAIVPHAFVDGSALARFAAAVLFVDLVSVYLAYLDGVDPTPVDLITELKQRISQ